MRLKLVFAASALAALVGAGACIALVLGVFSVEALSRPRPGLLVASTLLLPIATIIFSAIFVYRHTARRRKLQALLTTLIATLLTVGFFILAMVLSAGRVPTEPTQPAGPHIAA